jgi:predicted  nucleic acid-binding Zn-ribbon protein
MLTLIFNPWRRIRELQVELDRARNERDALDHALLRSTERYDKIRETNLQLRDALTLYRNNA